jgi:hypothetical protein
MSTAKTLVQEQNTKALRLKDELNSALDHLHRAYQNLNSLALCDDFGELYHSGKIIEVVRLRGRVFDLWIDGATLLTGMQQSLANAQGPDLTVLKDT